MAIITGDASVSCVCASETARHRGVDPRIGGVRVADRPSAGGESFRRFVGEPERRREPGEATARWPLRQSSALRIPPRGGQTIGRSDSGAGSFRYRVAAGDARSDAVSGRSRPAVGARSARHEIGHRVLPLRHAHVEGIRNSGGAKNRFAGEFGRGGRQRVVALAHRRSCQTELLSCWCSSRVRD